MGSKKRAARAKEVAAFKSQLADDRGEDAMDDLFAREDRRRAREEEERAAALRWKACERKNRYATRAEAEAAIAACARYGTSGLHCYKCPHCKGWHLTSKNVDE